MNWWQRRGNQQKSQSIRFVSKFGSQVVTASQVVTSQVVTSQVVTSQVVTASQVVTSQVVTASCEPGMLSG